MPNGTRSISTGEITSFWGIKGVAVLTRKRLGDALCFPTLELELRDHAFCLPNHQNGGDCFPKFATRLSECVKF